MAMGRASVVLLVAGTLTVEACAEIAGIDSWQPYDRPASSVASSAASGGAGVSVSSSTASSTTTSSTAAQGGGGAGTGGAATSTTASTGGAAGMAGAGGQDTCGDGMQNGLETDIDCGGPICGNCDVGLKCLDPIDCTSNCCKNGFCCYSCVEACDNYCQDANETGKDCGGFCGSTCTLGQGCLTDVDCIVGLTCQSFLCEPWP